MSLIIGNLYFQAIFDTLSHTYNLLSIKKKQYHRLLKKNKNELTKVFKNHFRKILSTLDKLKDRMKDTEIKLFGDIEGHYGKKAMPRIKVRSKFSKKTAHLHNLLYWKTTLEYLEDKFSFLYNALLKA